MKTYLLLVVGLSVFSASACSTVVVGRKASTTGRVIVGHAEDDGGNLRFAHAIVPARDWPADACIPEVPGRASTPQVPHTCRFWWSEVREPELGVSCADAFYNEHGVWLVSNFGGMTRPGDDLRSDDLTDGGVGYTVRRAVAERATSARHAVDIIADIISRWGYIDASRVYTVADKDEAWSVQILRGRRFAACRCPDDGVLFIPNHLTIRTLPERPTADAVWSADLWEWAETRGWWKPGQARDFAGVFLSDCWREIPHNTVRRRYILSLLLGREPTEKDFGFSFRCPKRFSPEDIARVMTAHPDGQPRHVKDSDGPSVCRGSTVEMTVCAFGAKPEETELQLARNPACEKGYKKFRPLAGAAAAGFDDGDGARRMDRHFDDLTPLADAATASLTGLALKAAVLRFERTKVDADRAECERLAERFFADTSATNLAQRTDDSDTRLLAWFLGVDACACSKAVGTNLQMRAKRAIDAVVPVVWPSAIDTLSAPTALFACRAIWSSTDALWWTDCFARYNRLREDPFEGEGTNRLDVCARGGFAPEAKPTTEQLLAVQIALHELCQRDRDGFAMRKFRDGLDRNAAAFRALALTNKLVDEFLRATADLKVRTNELTTAWGRKVTPENVWREYPRPQLVRRGAWQSLNGHWDFEHRLKDRPATQEKILVPFPVESPLSGVHRRVEATDELVYRRMFDVKRRAGFRTVLNFEAVDFRAQVFVNGIEATDVPHEGGSVPFSLDVTDLVKDGANELEVRVWDPSDTFISSTGKQTLQMHTCFFPASSGIIGSVWTEQVPRTYLADYGVTADPDTGRVVVTPQVAGDCLGAEVTVEVLWKGQVVATAKKGAAQSKVVLDLPKPLHLWSCEDPALYDLRITVSAAGGTDTVEGYFGVRRLAIAKDAKGLAKLALNGKSVYLLGVLDQGYWPDGHLTPPSEDACRWDVDYLKDIGVNCIRKHIKVEPRCFYAHCDRKGMLVLQDMPSAWHDGIQHDRDRANTRYAFARREMKEIVDHLGNHPSVVCWIPYNEGWSQPDEEKSLAVGRWLKRYDPTRLIDLASGWSHFEDGWTTAWTFDKTLVRPTSAFVTDIIDWHEYPGPKIAPANPDRPVICGEFSSMAGGEIDGHFSDIRGRAARYVPDTAEGLAAVREKNHKAYREQTDRVLKQVHEGSSGSILTESFDCFWEDCGYVTFDRARERFDRAFLRSCHREIRDAYVR